MKVLPADLRTAKSMAKALNKQLKASLGREDLTLQKTHELYAKSLGYASWFELAALLQQRHERCYLDDMPDNVRDEEAQAIWTRLASLLGFDYPHALVISAALTAGLGYSPQEAAKLKALDTTPWGLVEDIREVAPGIQRISTMAHGGYRLSPDRQKRIEQLLGFREEWFEEDEEGAIVEAAFPDAFNPQAAARRLHSTYPDLMEPLLGVSAEKYLEERIVSIEKAFQDNPDKWFIVDNLGHLSEFDGFRFGYYALTGRAALDWFQDHSEEAASSGKYVMSPAMRIGKAAAADPNHNDGADKVDPGGGHIGEDTSPTLGSQVPSRFEEASADIADQPDDVLSLFRKGEKRHSPSRFMQRVKTIRHLL